MRQKILRRGTDSARRDLSNGLGEMKIGDFSLKKYVGTEYLRVLTLLLKPRSCASLLPIPPAPPGSRGNLKSDECITVLARDHPKVMNVSHF